MNRRVDIYQKNKSGKQVIDLCSPEVKEELLKMHKSSRPSKNYHAHSNSGSAKNKKERNENGKFALNDDFVQNDETLSHSISGSVKNIYKGKVKS